MPGPALRVPRPRGEAVRQKLLAHDLLDVDREVGRDGDHLLLPLVEDAAGSLEDAGLDEPDLEVVDADLPPAERPPGSYRELLDLPPDLQDQLPSSWDVLGHVLVLKLPDDLHPHADAVADALLEANPPVRTVCLDRGVHGELRVRDLEVLAGEPSTETTHREHGVRIRVDPATVYFSPRLATERKRVADLVEDGETVVDLFAGVGPFALLIARHATPERVVAVDLNPEAVRYLRENVDRNEVGDVVEVREGDAREVAAELGPVADRVLMNLPHGARSFLDAALACANPAGAVVHLHAMVEKEDGALEDLVDELRAEARGLGWDLQLADHRVVRQYSRWEDHVVLDLHVEPRRDDADGAGEREPAAA